jgi:hypothetical protein
LEREKFNILTGVSKSVERSTSPLAGEEPFQKTRTQVELLKERKKEFIEYNRENFT